MRRLLSLSLLAFLLVWSGTALAQSTATLRGTITDAGTGEPLPGANVRLESMAIGAATDVMGRYEVAQIPVGSFTVVVSAVGYEAFRQQMTFAAGSALTLDASLRLDPFQMSELVVSGSLRPEKITDTPATIQIITARDLLAIPTTNPGELLARQKGVEYFRAGIATPAINVRGFNSNFNAKNLQVTDGRYSTLIATGLPFGPLDVVSAEDIEQQEIVLGPNGALFGPNAHNGLVNTITKDPRTSQGTVINARGGNQSQLGIGLRHAQVLSPRIAFKFNLDYSSAQEFAFMDTVYIARQPFNEYALNNDVEFIKGSAALYLTPRTGLDIILNYGGSNSTYLAPTNVGRNQINDWQIHVMQARVVSRRFFAQAYYTLSSTDNTYAIDQRTKDYWAAYNGLIAAGTAPAQARAQADVRSLQGEAVFRDDSRRINGELQYRDAFGPVSFVAGVQFQRDMANSKGSYLLDRDADDTINIDQTGGYAQATIDLPLGLRAVGALRVDNHQIYGTNVLPKAALLLRRNEGTYRLTYGRGIAAPTILNMYGKLFGGLILGNAEGFTMADGTVIEKQRVEKLQTFEAGFMGQLIRNRLFLDINAYYSMSEDFLSPLVVLGVAAKRGDTPISEVQPLFNVYRGLVASYRNFGEFNTYGLDVALTAALRRDLSLTVSYSGFGISFDETDLVRNDFNRDGVVNKLDHLVNAPANRAFATLSYDGPRVFGSVLVRWIEGYDYFSSFQIAAATQNLTYRGLPVRENARSADAWNYGQLGGFTTTDLGFGYKFGDNARLSMAFTNLFDVRQREFTASPFIGRLVTLSTRIQL